MIPFSGLPTGNWEESYRLKRVAIPTVILGHECRDEDRISHGVTHHSHILGRRIVVKTCGKNPVLVLEGDLKPDPDPEHCDPGSVRLVSDYQEPFGSKKWLVEGREGFHDIVDRMDMLVCTRPEPGFGAPECKGLWENTPVWDFEWQIKLPEDAKYEREWCGLAFKAALEEVCGPTFKMTSWACHEHGSAAEICFRFDLLCGRTRIRNAIQKASGGAIDVECPYFVQVPVPR